MILLVYLFLIVLFFLFFCFFFFFFSSRRRHTRLTCDWSSDVCSSDLLTLYRHAIGALVFGAGTVQWPWGLDSNHDNSGTGTDVNMQQATINLFADMTVQPSTLQAGLVPATASADTTPPTSTISSPANGASIVKGTAVTISGTATDAGGGTIGGVEVSTD